MPMPASIEEMWEMTAEKRAEKLENTQVNVGCHQLSLLLVDIYVCAFGERKHC
jgi:hypothetical protein